MTDPRPPTQPALLPWNRAYECGHALIDSEHRELFELGNEVLAAADALALQAALGNLFLHLAQHFADEEALLERLHYGQLDAHKRSHRLLLVRARALELQAQEGRSTPNELADFLALDVVAYHLLQRDRDYFPLLRG